MAKSNRDLVGEVLDTLKEGLGPYVLREYKQFYKGGRYLQEIELTLTTNAYSPPHLPDEATVLARVDVQGWLNLMSRKWDDVFRSKLGRSERSYVNELIDARNDWAHQKPIDDEDAYRTADTATRLLKAVGASKQAERTREIAQELLHPRVEPAPVITTKPDAPPKEAPPSSKYGVKLYWAGVPYETVVGFSTYAYKRWNDAILPGTRMLIYETAGSHGARGIVSEVEVVEGFAKSAGLPTPTTGHNHPVSVKVIHRRGTVPVIPLEELQAILKRPHYPQQNDSWTPITEAQYREFLKLWGER